MGGSTGSHTAGAQGSAPAGDRAFDSAAAAAAAGTAAVASASASASSWPSAAGVAAASAFAIAAATTPVGSSCSQAWMVSGGQGMLSLESAPAPGGRTGGVHALHLCSTAKKQGCAPVQMPAGSASTLHSPEPCAASCMSHGAHRRTAHP